MAAPGKALEGLCNGSISHFYGKGIVREELVKMALPVQFVRP
jgi:hypothetical protein